MDEAVSFLELGTSDTERSRPFFERVFGWQFHPMAAGGGWFQSPSIRIGMHGADPAPQIYVFFKVENLEQAIALVQGAGGEAGLPNSQPGFGRFSNCRDPQGVVFGLHEPEPRSVSA